jgi:hypothetical protein
MFPVGTNWVFIFQKTAFFIVTAVNIWNIACTNIVYQSSRQPLTSKTHYEPLRKVGFCHARPTSSFKEQVAFWEAGSCSTDQVFRHLSLHNRIPWNNALWDWTCILYARFSRRHPWTLQYFYVVHESRRNTLPPSSGLKINRSRSNVHSGLK